MMSEIYLAPYLQQSIFSTNPRQNHPKSPLRYPGGKARAVNQILKILPASIEILVSTFVGGGSVEIAAAHLGIKVIGYDIFTPLVDFWTELLLKPDVLADKVMEFFPLPKDRFYELQKMSFEDRLESAAVFYVLNRSSWRFNIKRGHVPWAS